MKVFNFFNSLLICFLIFILCISYYEEFIFLNEPCSLCILQRFFIVGIGIPLTFNITGPIRYRNISGSILSCILGSIVSLYQWSQLLINDGISYAPKILSLPMYIWAAMLFFGVAVILLLLSCILQRDVLVKSNFFSKLSCILFLLMVFSQIIVTFSKCGIFLC